MLNRTASKKQFPIGLYFASVFAAYAIFSKAIYGQHLTSGRVYLVYGIVAAIILSGFRLSYADATRAYRILMRSIIAFAIFYIVTSHIQVTNVLLQDSRLGAFELNYLWALATLFGVIGFIRPSFGLLPLLYIIWQKDQWKLVFDTPITWLDYFTLVETGSFLVLGYSIFAICSRIAPAPMNDLRGDAKTQPAGYVRNRSLHPIDILVLFAIALHFGNYYYAGLIKALLGDSPVDWALNNKTQILVLVAWDSAVLPVSFSQSLAALTYELVANIRVVTNLATITIQLLAALVIVRIRWAILITLSFDLLHLVIFITTGIFFWKFILLNLAIVVALSTMANSDVPRRLKFALTAAVIFSPIEFRILPSFAWLDTPSVNQVRIYAVTDDGSEYRVPSNYFLSASVNVVQDRWLWPNRALFPTQTWGTTRNNAIAKVAQRCDWERKDDEFPKSPYGRSRMQIERFIRRNHIQILSMIDDNGQIDYDMFPHHIFSMPWYFADFKKLDKRRIVSYRYESQAVCLGYENGRLTREVKHSASFDIPL